MTSKQKDNLLLENLYFNAVVEAADKCPECGCNPTHPKDECECDHDCDDEPVEEAKAKGGKPDYLDADGDGDKKEPMKKALKEKGKHSKFPKKGEKKK
jgi:hypothetical protein